jgi:subtilisin family serine protease
MNRTRSIIYIAIAIVIVLAIAFTYQFRQLQGQLRTSVHIVPTESKSRDAGAGLEDAGQINARPDVLVKFRNGVSADVIEQITTRLNDQVHDQIDAVPGLTAIDDRDNAEPTAIAAEYRALPEVEYAEPNYEISIEQTSVANASGNIDLSRQWALTQIDVQQAWNKTKGSREVVVAVLDSGIEYTHIDLSSNIWTRPDSLAPYHDPDLGTIDDVHGYNAIANDGNPLDDNGHGTACAGLIGADCGNSAGICGVNWHVQILPLRFINAGGFGSLADALAAINYAIDRKRSGVNLRVINASWELSAQSRALEEVVRKAYDVGILFVVSAGDSHTDIDVNPHYPQSLRDVISVAASNNADQLTASSNYGARSVQLAAPGEKVVTTVLGNDYAELSGSSFAAAIVSGVAALALSARPNLSVDELRAVLIDSADAHPELRQKVSTGGRINAAKAVGVVKPVAFSP